MRKKRKGYMAVILVYAMLFTMLPMGIVWAEGGNQASVEPSASDAAEYGLKSAYRRADYNKGWVTTWDCVWFGYYWQNDTNGDGKADKNDEKQPIKWRVLKVDGDDAFLLADRNLDTLRYHKHVLEEVTWETCTIRSWLNGYGAECNKAGMDYTWDSFMRNAFTSAEQEAIRTTHVENTPNWYYDVDGGNDTDDKIYFLSALEILRDDYGFSTSTSGDNGRNAFSTRYTLDGGEGDYKFHNEDEETWTGSWWWMRTPGSDLTRASVVHRNGGNTKNGLSVEQDSGCVRPVLHLDLSKTSLWSYAGTVTISTTVETDEVPPRELTEPRETPVPTDTPKPTATVTRTPKPTATEKPGKTPLPPITLNPLRDFKIKDCEVTYDGEEHTFTVPELPEGATIEFSEDGETWSSQPDTWSEIGVHGDYFRLSHAKFESVIGAVTVRIQPRKIWECLWDEIPDQKYTGEAIEPKIVLRDGDKVLTEGEDYELEFFSNINAGRAIVRAYGRGVYDSSKVYVLDENKDESWFNIVRDVATLKIDEIPTQYFEGKLLRPLVKVRDEERGHYLEQNKDFYLRYEETYKPEGTGYVTIYGQGLYYNGEKKIEFQIEDARENPDEPFFPSTEPVPGDSDNDIPKRTMNPNEAGIVTWTPGPIRTFTPIQTPPATGSSSPLPEALGQTAGETGNLLPQEKDKAIGVSSGASSGSTGSSKEEVAALDRPVIKKIVNQSGGKIKVTLREKVAGADSFQLCYARKKNFLPSKKKSFAGRSVTVKNLKKAKYYVRVRACKKRGKSKLYGKWSEVKRVVVRE